MNDALEAEVRAAVARQQQASGECMELLATSQAQLQSQLDRLMHGGCMSTGCLLCSISDSAAALDSPAADWGWVHACWLRS